MLGKVNSQLISVMNHQSSNFVSKIHSSRFKMLSTFNYSLLWGSFVRGRISFGCRVLRSFLIRTTGGSRALIDLR